ncbi:MAG: molecular chaperone [Candidatus Electrothrix sp. AU1_5]|nr:molecular chaperone [Candidatus Electrothrix gigas]
MKTQKIFLVMLLGLLIIADLQNAQAAKIRIWPVKVTIWPNHATESVRLTNEEDRPVNVQVSATSWDMDENGKFIETDTGDFVFFPRLLTLPPHEQKVVRVGYQGKFPDLEKPYRLLIQELPPVRSPEKLEDGKQKLGLTYVLKLSLPLFVMPSKEPPVPKIAVDGVKTTEKGLKIGVRAPGSHHIQVTKLEAQLLDSADAVLASGENKTQLLRILPHRRVFVEVPLDSTACSKAKNMLVKVEAKGLKTPYEQRIPLTGGTCQAAGK